MAKSIDQVMKEIKELHKKIDSLLSLDKTHKKQEKQNNQKRIKDIEKNLKKYYCYDYFIKGIFENPESIRHLKKLKKHLNKEVYQMTLLEHCYWQTIGLMKIKLINIDSNNLAHYKCYFLEPKKTKQLKDIAKELLGSFSDGFGEGYEQYPFYIEKNGKEHFYSMCDIYNQLSYFKN